MWKSSPKTCQHSDRRGWSSRGQFEEFKTSIRKSKLQLLSAFPPRKRPAASVPWIPKLKTRGGKADVTGQETSPSSRGSGRASLGDNVVTQQGTPVISPAQGVEEPTPTLEQVLQLNEGMDKFLSDSAVVTDVAVPGSPLQSQLEFNSPNVDHWIAVLDSLRERQQGRVVLNVAVPTLRPALKQCPVILPVSSVWQV